MALAIKDLYWVAGILEGEGSFYISTRDVRPKICVSLGMLDGDVVEEVFNIVNIGTMNGPYKNGVYMWQVNKQEDAAALMMTLYPLMKEKRQREIKNCLTTWRSFPYQWQRPCIRGHEYTENNTYVNSRGTRSCKECRKQAARRFRDRNLLWH